MHSRIYEKNLIQNIYTNKPTYITLQNALILIALALLQSNRSCYFADNVAQAPKSINSREITIFYANIGVRMKIARTIMGKRKIEGT